MASFFNVNPQLLSQLGGSVGNIKQAPIGDIVNAERDRQFKQQATLQELDIQKQGFWSSDCYKNYVSLIDPFNSSVCRAMKQAADSTSDV